jgi:hypothetical protein
MARAVRRGRFTVELKIQTMIDPRTSPAVCARGQTILNLGCGLKKIQMQLMSTFGPKRIRMLFTI